MNFKKGYLNKFIETHPFPIFENENTSRMIIGTFPAWEFTSGDSADFDSKNMIKFNYGRIRGRGKNLLWKLLGEVYQTELSTAEAIKECLATNRIGVADVCFKVFRKKPKSSNDNDLEVIEYNQNLIKLLQTRKQIHTLIFTSKNAFEWYKIFIQPEVERSDFTLINNLPAMSQGANLYIASLPEYKSGHFKNTHDYRLSIFIKYFL